MGDGIYGAQAASKTFFKKDAKYMTKSECATIAAVLPNPIKFNAGRPSAYTQKRRGWVMNQMSLWGGVLRYEEVEEKPVKKKNRK